MSVCEFQSTCMNLSKCDAILSDDHNEIENMVIIPDCYKEKPKINQNNEGNINERQFKK